MRFFHTGEQCERFHVEIIDSTANGVLGSMVEKRPPCARHMDRLNAGPLCYDEPFVIGWGTVP